MSRRMGRLGVGTASANSSQSAHCYKCLLPRNAVHQLTETALPVSSPWLSLSAKTIHHPFSQLIFRTRSHRLASFELCMYRSSITVLKIIRTQRSLTSQHRLLMAAAITPVNPKTNNTTLAQQSAPLQPPVSHKPDFSWKHNNPDTRVIYIRDIEQANNEVEKMKVGPVGFDLEWRPTFAKGAPENPVALVQLANQDTVLLIQVSAMSGNSRISSHLSLCH